MAKPRRGDRVTSRIDDLAFGGEGVGRAGGYVMFVRGGLPGDRFAVQVIDPRTLRPRLIEFVEGASPHRVDPPWRIRPLRGLPAAALSYAGQLAFKEKQVRDCLRAARRPRPDFELRPILPRPGRLRLSQQDGVHRRGASWRARIVGLHEADRYDP